MRVNFKHKIIISLLISISFLVGATYLFKNEPEKPSHRTCLSNDEIATYSFEKADNLSGHAIITIKNRRINQIVTSFQIENVRINYHPIELNVCGAYMVRMFNYDYRMTKQNPGYREELWKYNYIGQGGRLLLLAEKPKEFISYYSPDFRVNTTERYLALTRGYFGSSDYAIVIKDLKTLEDVFTLSMADIEKKNPDIVGNIGFKSWSRDGHYFWADTAYGANTLGFIRIDSQNWNVALFLAPKDVLGGDALNLKNGYITVHPGNVWFGVAEVSEEEKARRRAQGIGTELYIYNLFTGERHFVDETDEPLWYFKPQWLSDTELEYYLPTGERKVYNLEK